MYNLLGGENKIMKVCNFLTLTAKSGRIGNEMFQYASLYGLAKANYKQPFLNTSSNFAVTKIFNLSIPYGNSPSNNFVVDEETACCEFKENSTRMNCDQNVTLEGFRQSYKYFDKYKIEIKKEFTFRDSVLKHCQKVIHRMLRRFEAKNITNCFLVGVHMRRGDFVYDLYQDAGFVPAEATYLRNAIDYYEKRLLDQCPCLVFLVTGNDITWNLNNVPKKFNIIVLPPNSAAVDLCVLSKCNASIISTGSFGWWAAYLADGPTTYMKYQCRPNSPLCEEFELNDYINPSWDWTPL